MQLNAEQRRAVMATEGPVIIEAGPGSGKTTVITRRAAHLLEAGRIPPSKLLLVTFTRQAAQEIKERIGALLSAERAERIAAGTIHGMALRLLHELRVLHEPRVLTDQRALAILRELLEPFDVDLNDDTPREVLTEIGDARNRMKPPEEYPAQSVDVEVFRQVARRFLDWKRRAGVLDFDDMLVRLFVLLRNQSRLLAGRFSHIMVDEFQDVSPLQYDIIKRLAAPLNNVCVCGDVDQSLYSWRGAGPKVMLAFPQDFPDAVRITLDRNYRASEALVSVTNRLISYNRARFPKTIRSQRNGGEAPQIITTQDEVSEAAAIASSLRKLHETGIPWREMAVIYRTNFQALPFLSEFNRRGLPIRLLSEPPNPLRHWVGRDMLSYLQLAFGERSPELLDRIIYRPNRFIPKSATRAAMGMFAQGSSLSEAYRATGELSPFQLEGIETLEEQLSQLAKETVAGNALTFIWETIGYKDYIKARTERAPLREAECTGMMAMLHVLAREHPDLHGFTEWGRALQNAEKGWWHSDDPPFRLANGKPGWGESVSVLQNGDADAITLSTCHSAKGLEFDVVVVAGLADGVLPYSLGEQEEERRLCYVAMTRARNRLILSGPTTLLHEDRPLSPFLQEALDWPLKEQQADLDSEFTATWKPGDRIRHKSFGTGQIIGLRRADGFMDVHFAKMGRKLLHLESCLERKLLQKMGES